MSNIIPTPKVHRNLNEYHRRSLQKYWELHDDGREDEAEHYMSLAFFFYDMSWYEPINFNEGKYGHVN